MNDDIDRNHWTLRMRPLRDGYEIVEPLAHGGRVVDTITMAQLARADRPNDLVYQRMEKAKKEHQLHRVARFARLLQDP